MLTWHWKKFNELTLDELYAVLALRADVFVVEQHCYYLDPDGRDQHAQHLLGVADDGQLVAYLRLFPPHAAAPYLSFGRVVIAKNARKCGYGKELIAELLNYCSTHYADTPVECSAQYYLTKFYQGFGFETTGNPYDDAGIEHIKMILTR